LPNSWLEGDFGGNYETEGRPPPPTKKKKKDKKKKKKKKKKKINIVK